MVRIRDDYSAADRRWLAKTARTTFASRRMLSFALILEGCNRAEAGGMERQTLHRFNAEGPEGLYDKQRPGTSCRFGEAQHQELTAIIETGPDPAEHGVVRFRLCDLCALVEQRFGVTHQEQGLSKLIKKLGFRRLAPGRSPPKAIPRFRPSIKKFQDLVGDAVDGDRADSNLVR